MKRKLSAISLFSGCGGMDLGFLQAGFKISWAVDIDWHVCETYRFNLGDQIHCLDINDVNFDSIPKADVLICGPPCQGFSNIGKRDHVDKRNSLYLNVLQVVKIKKPMFVVIENVKGLLSFQKGAVLNRLLLSLKSYGYKVEWKVLNAIDYGLSQNRERIFIVANNIGSDNFFNKLGIYKKKSLPLKMAIGDIEEVYTLSNHSNNKNNNPVHNKIISRISQGQKLCDTRLGRRSIHTWQIPEVFGITSDIERKTLYAMAKNRRLKRFRKKESWNDASPLSKEEISLLVGKDFDENILYGLIEKGYIKEKFSNLYDLTHTFNGKFRRLDYEKPSEAILTNFGSPRNYIHPKKNRPLTVRECGRIQGFPDSFIFKGPENNQYKQVGNAVPPVLSQIIANEIKILLRNTSSKRHKIISYIKHFTPYSIDKVICEFRKYNTPNLGNFSNPLNELIYLYISQRTFEKSYKSVFKELKKTYPTFDNLRCAGIGSIEKILKPAGLAKQKAVSINKALTKIYNDFGETSLRKLKKFNETSKLEYLLGLPRVGIKTAYCILLFCFGIEVLPIDANISRVCERLGWLSPNLSSKKSHKVLHSIIQSKYRYEFHVNCISHARSTCLPVHPTCSDCCISELCPSSKE